MPRARPCGRARLCSAPTTLRARDPNSAPTTLFPRATQARGTPVDGAVHGAWCPHQDCAMGRSFSRARIRATQCQSERSTTGAMGEGSPDEPLPRAIQDAVAAAIEDGATMDEIVTRVRSRGGDRSRSRAHDAARARPAEGCWAERMDGLICLQRETDRFAEEWARAREPGAEGRQRAHRDRDPANAGAPHDGRARPARGAGGGGGPRPPRAGALPHRKRRQAPHRARAGGGRSRRTRTPERPRARPV